ncbi:hypothetical protein NKH23_29620 [Mesorhizobium sp. M1328]
MAGVFKRLSFAGVTIVTLSEDQKIARSKGSTKSRASRVSARIATI